MIVRRGHCPRRGVGRCQNFMVLSLPWTTMFERKYRRTCRITPLVEMSVDVRSSTSVWLALHSSQNFTLRHFFFAIMNQPSRLHPHLYSRPGFRHATTLSYHEKLGDQPGKNRWLYPWRCVGGQGRTSINPRYLPVSSRDTTTR
jgi:hypothetical protein